MIILHGTYDNGKIEIKEKDLPDIKSAVEIKFLDPNVAQKREALLKVVGQFDFGGIFDGADIRDLIYD